MNLHNHQETDEKENKFLIWVWLLVALFINFAFILLAGWLAFVNVATDSISASMLAGSEADYGVTDYTIQFAPVSQNIIDEIDRDSRALQVTPNSSSEIGDNVVQFPPTTTPVPPTQSPTITSTGETAVSPTPAPQTPTATSTLSGNTATPDPLATEEIVTATSTPPFATPTIIPTSQSSSTPVPQSTNTPVPQPTNTPVPQPTNTPVPPPTNTPVPPPTNTPIPPTNTPVPPPTPTPGFGITPIPTTSP